MYVPGIRVRSWKQRGKEKKPGFTKHLKQGRELWRVLGYCCSKQRFQSSVEVVATEVFSTKKRPWEEQGHVLDSLKQTSPAQAG